MSDRPITLDYSTEEAAKYNWMDKHKFNLIKEWCERSFIKSNRYSYRHSSCGFKHW